MPSLKKIFSVVLTIILLVVSGNAFAGEQSITVQVTGQGVNKTEALEDALRLAVRKVVGTYVVTQTTLKEEDFDEAIYVNADAVVTKHRELKTTEADGVVSLTIEATVVKNDLLKYIAKNESTRISSTDLGNLLNRRKALSTAEKTLDYIFRDYASQMFQAKKVGDFSLGANDDVENDTVCIEMRYELRFNLDAYAKFEKRLKNLLSKVAVAETSGQAPSENFFNYRGPVASFNNSEESKSWPTGTKTIIFCDEVDDSALDRKDTQSSVSQGTRRSRRRQHSGGSGELLNYHFFAVPNQVYEKITALTDEFCVIVFQFDVRGKDKPLKRYIQPSIRFFRQDDWGRRKTIDFRNRMWVDIRDYERVYGTKSEFKKTWSFSEDDVRSMKSCTLKIYSGQTARYLWYVDCREAYKVRKLAWRGYIPAMIAMAEIFRENKWYNNAALMGSRQAQEKCDWQNGGLGFEIIEDREADVFWVWSARKGVPVKKGMVLKTINGAKIPQRTEELAKLIGAFSPGESVSVEFTNGKKINLTVQDR